ncbi:hypothetical protein LQL77_32270 [Rhodococcus cerastii]|nr:hypothetical protein [Rhodococcus cerastii]
MKHSFTTVAVGAGAVLATLILPGVASAASVDLPFVGGSVEQTVGGPVGPRLDGTIVNDTPNMLKLEASGVYSGNIIQAPSSKIAGGPSAHGTFEVQSRALSAVEADFHYKIEGTDFRVEFFNSVPTFGQHHIECSIVDGAGHTAKAAPFSCNVTERNGGTESWWNPSPLFTVQAH